MNSLYLILAKDIEYIPIWEFQISPRATINISKMIDPQKERDFSNNEEYLKNLETKDEYLKESKKRIKIKKDHEKFYINSVIIGYNQKPFRTKGPSIFRHQIPSLIEILQNIHNGEYDAITNKILLESGIIKKDWNETVLEDKSDNNA